ncbi:MAG: Gfo/Idh/MocA family protein [Verrucomicrobiales bacterium]
MTRRYFTTNTLAAATATSMGVAAEQGKSTGKLRAAIIGHTGEGDYGHGLDLIFNDRDDVEVVAVADADAEGRAKAVQHSKAQRQYGDWRELIEKEKPQLVCLASRWTHERYAMGKAALQAGAHLFTEKPFTTTLAEADELLAAAEQSGRKIAVAHQMRLAPSVIQLKKAIDDGMIGDFLEMRAWGKQDDRAGGEDMLVLGTHLFDLMRFFAGTASWCTARVLHQGRDITKQDARPVKERIGPVAGDEISAQFGFEHGIHGTFTSRKRLRSLVGHWGIEFTGSKTKARLLADVYPAVYLLKAGSWTPTGRTDQWHRWENDPGATVSAEERGFAVANRRLVDDWIDGIAKNREPACSGTNAMKSIEMVMAVYHAALQNKRISLPLNDRQHPLGGATS